jgi:simple sugar transport system ATP-binding protein
MERILIRMEGIKKEFPNVVANNNVNFELFGGEVHCLLGENGAGKTTLMRILIGLEKADSGNIYFEGKRIKLNSPSDAKKLGITMVPQNFLLIPNQSVAENIALREAKNMINPTNEVIKRMQEIKKKYNLFVEPNRKISMLSEGEKQKVEIIKAIYNEKNKVIILDEPTSLLTQKEIDEVFNLIKKLKNEGKGIIFITHKLDEVFEIGDRVSVMRDGKVIATKRVKDTTKEELARMMVEREVSFKFKQAEKREGNKILEVKNVSTEVLHDISFEINSFEIFGIAGIAGNGQDELAEVVSGIKKPINGEVIFEGKNITNFSIRKRMEIGIGYIPEKRLSNILPNFSIRENLVLKSYFREDFSNGQFLKLKNIDSFANEAVKRFNIKCPSIETKASNLSGGNVQKLILAQTLSQNPKLIIACNPTYGLDVGASEEIRNQLINERNIGKAILLISQDLEEVLGMSDKVAIINKGRFVGGIRKPKEFSKEEIGELMGSTIKENQKQKQKDLNLYKEK